MNTPTPAHVRALADALHAMKLHVGYGDSLVCGEACVLLHYYAGLGEVPAERTIDVVLSEMERAIKLRMMD